MVFEAVRGNNYFGDIAIDDVRMYDGVCPPEGSCDFEDDTCTWTNVLSDDFDWTRQAGNTASFGTGPSADHTLGDQQGRTVNMSITTQ